MFSPYVVKYYGSYFKNTDLWIVMEYCGAGSVSDIIRLRNKTVSFLLWNAVIDEHDAGVHLKAFLSRCDSPVGGFSAKASLLSTRHS